jgi:hypothetical protein
LASEIASLAAVAASPGALNGDTHGYADDILAFQLALTNPAAYENAFPGLERVALGDINFNNLHERLKK